MKSTGLWYKIKSEAGPIIDARLRGKLQLKGSLRATNPIAVGDIVHYELENETSALIYEIAERKNYLIRRATNLSKEVHIVAANIDQLVLLTSIANPRVPVRFVDRVLLSAEAYQIEPILILNKKDLIEGTKLESRRGEFLSVYKNAGYDVYEISALDKNDLRPIKKLLDKKCTALAGFSGVGKSTLIKELFDQLDLKTASVSHSSKKGKHTTTFAEMFEPEKDTYIIDTPGIKSLGIIGIDNWEFSHFFPEMREVLSGCKFNNCLHVHEPGCAVIEAVENGQIAERRYESYLYMLEEDQKFR